MNCRVTEQWCPRASCTSSVETLRKQWSPQDACVALHDPPPIMGHPPVTAMFSASARLSHEIRAVSRNTVRRGGRRVAVCRQVVWSWAASLACSLLPTALLESA